MYTIGNGYWDTETSGQPGGLTTSALQNNGLAARGFDSSIWGGGTGGIYPYLKSFFPNGVQAVSGIAYTDAGVTPLASGAAGAAYVSAMANGASLGSATTGANGYYYVFGPAGSIASGQSLLAYTTADATTGATNAATLTSATGAANQAGIDIWGNTLIAPTAATSYSAASATPLQTQDAALIASAVGANTGVATLVGGLTDYGYIATGASFTIDQPLTLSNGLYVRTTASNAAITVGEAITLPGTNGLSLLATGDLNILNTITVTGAGAGLVLNAAGDLNIWNTVSVPNGGTVALSYGGDYSFGLTGSGFAGNIDFGDTDNGASLSINGSVYTLKYTMAQLQGIDGSFSQYALATDLTATTSYGSVVGSFFGSFTGLGHTISDLTTGAGLFGYLRGTIRDIGLVGGSASGGNNVGSLVGYNFTGTISNAYATGTVSGGNFVGGLVGWSQNGTIANVYATGAVSGAGSVGGLVGQSQYDTIDSAYATGAVSGASGSAGVGGLVGFNVSTISNAYATGAVSGGSYVGGLLGLNNGRDQQCLRDRRGQRQRPCGRAGRGQQLHDRQWLLGHRDQRTTGRTDHERAAERRPRRTRLRQLDLGRRHRRHLPLPEELLPQRRAGGVGHCLHRRRRQRRGLGRQAARPTVSAWSTARPSARPPPAPTATITSSLRPTRSPAAGRPSSIATARPAARRSSRTRRSRRAVRTRSCPVSTSTARI